MGDTAGAITDYTSAIASNPQLGDAYYGRALLQVELGNLNAAMQDFETASTLFLEMGMAGRYRDTLEQMRALQ
jgi:tetratricopeptide (TPR) repeat protein